MEGFRRVRCVIQRGGTSKGVFLHDRDLPADPASRERVILAIFGSPDKRQIDGLGGADPLTSKVAILKSSARDDADVDYTFGAVGIAEGMVDFRGNCGNISSGVGPFAIDEGLVKATDPMTVVRIFNTNTQKLLLAHVGTRNGQVVYAGDCRIDGVPGTSAPIALDYSATAGSATGKLLPTGRVIDEVVIPSLGKIRMSIVDAGNPMCFIRPDALGLSGTEGPADPQVLAALDAVELIRGTAAALIGMVGRPEDARSRIPSIPMLAFVSEAADYTSFTGERIAKEDIDFVSRLFYMQEMHKTYAGTGTVATGAAAMIEGTLVNEVNTRRSLETKIVRIGHPSGVIEIDVEVAHKGGGFELRRAAFNRTSRRIMDGTVYVPESLFG